MATNTQKEFRKQMKALAKEGKVPKSSSRKTVKFIEPRTIRFGGGTFLLFVIYNLVSGLINSVPVQPTDSYEMSVYDVVYNIDQRETQLINQITAQIKNGKGFTSSEMANIKKEINALRDELPAISEIEGAVSIENRQLDQIDAILMNLSDQPVIAKQIESINNAITIYNGLDINADEPVALVNPS